MDPVKAVSGLNLKIEVVVRVSGVKRGREKPPALQR
jgi:hypothetical protein